MSDKMDSKTDIIDSNMLHIIILFLLQELFI